MTACTKITFAVIKYRIIFANNTNGGNCNSGGVLPVDAGPHGILAAAEYGVSLEPDWHGMQAPGGEIVLAGFYTEALHFNFAPAFMREAQIRAAAEWQRADMLAVKQLAEGGRLCLDGLITHRERAEHATGAYETAFTDAGCLKMVLDWRSCQ